LGLVAQVVQADALDAAIAAEVAPYLDCAPGAVAAAKLLALRLGAGIDDAAVSDSIDALVAQWEGTEAAEGIAAFFEKRKPRWAS
jgi:methylglutaconyl-CoA hydratase